MLEVTPWCILYVRHTHAVSRSSWQLRYFTPQVVLIFLILLSEGPPMDGPTAYAAQSLSPSFPSPSRCSLYPHKSIHLRLPPGRLHPVSVQRSSLYLSYYFLVLLSHFCVLNSFSFLSLSNLEWLFSAQSPVKNQDFSCYIFFSHNCLDSLRGDYLSTHCGSDLTIWEQVEHLETKMSEQWKKEKEHKSGASTTLLKVKRKVI